MGFTFQLCAVARAVRPLPEVSPQQAVATLLGTPAEACGAGRDTLVPVATNAFLAAAWRAYADHRPLVLTPDAVWLTIAQGFAAHVNHDAEAPRGRFVRHPDGLTLRVVRDDFLKGSPDNPWPEVFADFSQQIAGHIGRQRDLVVCDFSTTGPIERAASELVLLDAMQQYLDYEIFVICGIPEITLAGTVDDWRSVRQRTAMLAEYGLEWWTSVLLPVLAEFEATAAGRPDLAFWHHFIEDSEGGECGGGTHLHGWILLFFPLVTGAARDGRLQRSPVILAADGKSPVHPSGGVAAWLPEASLEPARIPVGLSSAPLRWSEPGGTHHDMDLIGGFVGIAQDSATLALRPAVGWAVRDHADRVHVHKVESQPSAASNRHRGAGDEPTAELIAELFKDDGRTEWTAREAPDDGVFVASEHVLCSRTGNGRLLLTRNGLYFIPGSDTDGSAAAVVPWLGRALTDDDDLPPVPTDSFVELRGRSPAEQVAAMPGAIHLPVSALADAVFTTTDHGVETVVGNFTSRTYSGPGPSRSLEIAVRMPDGEHLTFTLHDPPLPLLAAWRDAIGS